MRRFACKLDNWIQKHNAWWQTQIKAERKGKGNEGRMRNMCMLHITQQRDAGKMHLCWLDRNVDVWTLFVTDATGTAYVVRRTCRMSSCHRGDETHSSPSWHHSFSTAGVLRVIFVVGLMTSLHSADFDLPTEKGARGATNNHIT